MADLDNAIQIAQEAIDTTSKDHPERAGQLGNLGSLFGERYLRTGAMADLDNAIQTAKEAVDITPKDHPNQAIWLSHLGNRLGDRFLRLGAMADLENAIQIMQEAVDITPKDHPDRAGRLSNLGIRFGDRSLRTGAMTDLENAIQTAQEAVDTTPKDHPDRARLLSNLGSLFGNRYSRTGAIADWEEAKICNQSALRQSNSPTIDRILAGKEVLRLCAITSDWQQAHENSSTAVHLVPKLTLRSLENSDKQHLLSQVVGLASDATAVALQVRTAPPIALKLLEQGRNILASSLGELRTDMLDLPRRHPELADQFVRLRDEIERPFMQNALVTDENRKSSLQTQASRRYNAGKAFDELINKIRKQPNFEDFLLPPNEEKMQNAAKCGPIVVINVSEYRCDALLVEQHQIRSLALPNLKNKEIKEKARRGGLGSSRILEWLWDVAANPILDAFGFTQPPSDNSWPHIWWIPTGILSKFPLHAAGYHSSGSTRTVLDRVMSSYSSSVRAIIHDRPSRTPKFTQSTSPKALLVAMQDTPKQRPLPFVTIEVAIVRRLCQSMALDPIEPGCHKQDIVSHLPNCKILHFAGHGDTDESDPSQSHLLTKDWESDRLTVANLLEMNLRERSPFLAYLSACGTGQIHKDRFLDESIHLISACQMAGFRHVIGTLWGVDDDLCQDMARYTYEEMKDGIKDGHMTDKSVCLGLHKATRKLRDRWLGLPAKVRHSNGLVERIAMERERDITSASKRDQQGSRSQRPFKLVDSDDKSDTPASQLNWAPYVHFGV